MNDIQRNYLIGLVLKKVRQLNQESLKEVNVNNDMYLEHIESFVENNAANGKLISIIISFVNSEEVVLMEEGLTIEKIGLYTSVKTKDTSFTINQDELLNILFSIQSYMKEYLPLGTIVLVDKNQVEGEATDDVMVMIEQRMIHPKGKDYFVDYRAIPYPMGIFNEQMYVYFSADAVVEVVHLGYSDLENEGYELALKESLIDNNIFSVSYQNQK